jgi:hypothetical protein
MGNEEMWICIRIHHAVLNHTNQFLQDDTYINMQAYRLLLFVTNHSTKWVVGSFCSDFSNCTSGTLPVTTHAILASLFMNIYM